MKCTLCQVFIPNHERVIETHVDGGPHSNRYLKRLQTQNNIVVNEYEDCDQVVCVICDQYFSNSNDISSVQQHIATDQHKRSMEEVQDAIEGHFMDLPVDGSRQVHCTICKSKVGFTLSCIEEHTDGGRHRKALAVAVQKYNGIFEYEITDEELWCKICDISIDNDVDSILDHVDNDADHIAKCEELENLVEDEEISIEKYLSDVGTHSAHCKRCDVDVPCNVYNLKQHIEGTRHDPDSSDSEESESESESDSEEEY